MRILVILDLGCVVWSQDFDGSIPPALTADGIVLKRFN